MSQPRARKPEEKTERRAVILAAAQELSRKTSFADFKMSKLAERAGLGKGTLYLYFEAKEHIFLELLEASLYPWMETLAKSAGALTDGSGKKLARMFRKAFEDEPVVDRLLPMLEGVIEHGIDKKAVLAFKQRFLEHAAPLAAAIEQALPEAPRGCGMGVLTQIRAFHTGLRQMADPAPAVAEVLKDHPELRPLHADFGPALESALARLFRGLKREGK